MRAIDLITELSKFRHDAEVEIRSDGPGEQEVVEVKRGPGGDVRIVTRRPRTRLEMVGRA